MAEALYYILDTIWKWKLNHKKTAGMWAQSQTARLCKLKQVLTRWETKLTASSARGTLHCYRGAGFQCDKLQERV